MTEFRVGPLCECDACREEDCTVSSFQEATDHVRKLSPGKEPYGVWDSQGLSVAIMYDGFVFDLRLEGCEYA